MFLPSLPLLRSIALHLTIFVSYYNKLYDLLGVNRKNKQTKDSIYTDL